MLTTRLVIWKYIIYVSDGSNIDPSLILIMPFQGTSIRQVEHGLKDRIIESLLYGNETRQVCQYSNEAN